jgi:hypothetical protein
MSKEIYKSLENFEHIYKISNLGNIININTYKNKKYCIKSNGYYYVTLCKNGENYVKTVHSLVAKTFLCKNINNDIIDHIDGNKLNNNILNLRYTSYSINTLNAYKNNKNMSNRLRKVFKFNNKFKLVIIYKSLSECRKDNNFKYNSKIVTLSNSKKIYNKFYYELERKKIKYEEKRKLKKEKFIIINKYFNDSFSNYLISENGNILNIRTNKLMKILKLKNDYEKIILVNNNKKPKKINIHRLVAYKFINEYDKDKVIHHLDENKQNNYYKNLEITTNKQNIRYSKSKKIIKYDLKMNLIKKYNCIKDASDELKIKNSGNIIKCCKGKIKTAYKFIWRYDN